MGHPGQSSTSRNQRCARAALRQARVAEWGAGDVLVRVDHVPREGAEAREDLLHLLLAL